MSDRLPGTSWDNPIWYRDYRIHVGPGYTRDSQWQYVHDDYDGADDSTDRRYGFGTSEADCKAEIDELEEELAAEAAKRAVERLAERAEYLSDLREDEQMRERWERGA